MSNCRQTRLGPALGSSPLQPHVRLGPLAPRLHPHALPFLLVLPLLLPIASAQLTDPVLPGFTTPDDVALREKSALLSLARSLGNHPVFVFGGWSNVSLGLTYATSKPCVQFWEFVTCDGDGRVNGIDLPAPTLALLNAFWAPGETPGSLSGSLPWGEMGALEHLEAVNLSGNDIKGAAVTSHVSALHRLREIQLSDNLFDQPIADEINTLTALQKLDVSHNNISGSIPSGLSSLSSLSSLIIAGNRLEGRCPEEMGDLTGLVRLDLSNNRFSGELPTKWSQLSNLRLLDVSQNYLRGEVPLPPSPNMDFDYSSNCLDVSGAAAGKSEQRSKDACAKYYAGSKNTAGWPSPTSGASRALTTPQRAVTLAVAVLAGVTFLGLVL